MSFKIAFHALITVANLALLAAAQDEVRARLRVDLTALASPEMAGRGNGQDGLDKAIKYMVNSYRSMGLRAEMQRFPYPPNRTKKEPDGYLRNVIVTIKGTDPELNAQHIIVGAHLDHLGSRPNLISSPSIYFGADDNASGSAALLELARYFSENRPRRSLVFIHFTGEEWGLFGSKHWIEHPTVDIKSVRFMFNLDMIGRLDPKERNLTFTAMGMGLDDIAKAKAMAPQGIAVKIDRGRSIFSESSDHAPFAARGIPTCFFFTGLHPDYHQVSDTPEKINWDGLATITQYTKELIAKYASNNEIPAFHARGNLGVKFNFDRQLLVQHVTPDGSANAAGLKFGDIITQINDHLLKTREDFDDVMDLFNKGDNIKLKWKRNDKYLDAEVVLR